ncbi:MAG: PAS domain S-box protein [Comamonadaceae bacterium]|nr:MAG: PAS domain S-box protein [Comamonadaceae bacterium]
MLNRPALESAPKAFLAGGGELGDLIAAHDWGATPLGDIAGWGPTLKATVTLILQSAVPIVTLWGESGVMIYNNAYSVFAGGRHPALLGTNVREGWPEVADFNDHVMKTGLAGETLAYQDQELTLFRHGTGEQVWMNLDYSPIRNAGGDPIGVIAIVVETTGKVVAERTANAERARLKQMFEQGPGFMALLSGPDHVVELANPAYMQLIGHRDVLGKSVRDALPELEEQGYFELLDQVAETGEAFSGFSLPVSLSRTRDSEPEMRHVDLVYQPIVDAEKGVIGIFAQGVDVTERVAAEAAVRASEAEFRALAQAMPNHVWAAGTDGMLDWFNERVYEYSGALPGTLKGESWVRMVHPEDVTAATRRWQQSLETGETYEIEFRLRQGNGQYRWHISRAVPIRNEAGDIVRWVGTNTDIEEQKASAQALRHLNETLEAQVATRTAERDRMWRLSTDIMLVADFQANIVSTNPAWTTLLGWSDSDLLGRPFLEFVHLDDLGATMAEVEKLEAGETTLKFENRYQRKDGSYCTLSWTAVPEKGFIHAVGRDVTADKESAEALRQAEAALYQAQKMETVGKLTGGVAHDFNNLLQVVAGNLHLLSKAVVGNERAERQVANALAGVSRGAKLSSQLLAFARRQPLEPKVVNLARLVYGMEDMLRRSLGEEIETETVISGGLWNTSIDPAQVENAILNLAINARDAMNGSGKLTIEVGNAFLDDAYALTHSDVVAGQYVVLAVSDTGSGMPEDVIAQAFEPFFSTKPEGKGTGLGLSMVYGFVKQSGGHVKIYSEVGHGTTIKLYLPRTLKRIDAVAPVDFEPVAGGNETILVAEDDDEVRATVIEILGDLGYRILKASDAASALAIVESGVPIDMLFTDVVMPGTLRSPELARRAREHLPNIAVLFTSGYTENAIVHGGRLDAGVDLIGKPYTQEALARKIRAVLSAQRQRNLQVQADMTNPGIRRKAPESTGAPMVLLVEDDELICANTAELMRELGYDVVEAHDAHEALVALRKSHVDILMTDLGLPGISGEELAQLAVDISSHLSVIFATGHMGYQSRIKDAIVLVKPYDGDGIEDALKKALALRGD